MAKDSGRKRRYMVSAEVPEQGDLVMYERRDAATRYCHLFSRDEIVDLAQGAGFTDTQVLHTSDLGEAWGHVFVVVFRG